MHLVNRLRNRRPRRAALMAMLGTLGAAAAPSTVFATLSTPYQLDGIDPGSALRRPRACVAGLCPPAPGPGVVMHVTPDAGWEDGGVEATVTGVNLDPSMTVMFDTSPASVRTANT